MMTEEQAYESLCELITDMLLDMNQNLVPSDQAKCQAALVAVGELQKSIKGSVYKENRGFAC